MERRARTFEHVHASNRALIDNESSCFGQGLFGRTNSENKLDLCLGSHTFSAESCFHSFPRFGFGFVLD